MAVWSKVLRSNINEIDRFDAEYYKPEYITINHLLDKIKAERINPYLEFVNCGPFGSTIKNETYTSDGVIVARPFNINSCVFELDNLVFIREEDCKRKNLTLYKDRDVFFARVGDIRVGILSSFYLSRKVTISPNIIATRFKNKNIYPEYVVAFFNTVLGHKQIEQALKVVAQPTISTKLIRKLRIFVPSLNIQKEISKIFNKSLELKQVSQSLYTQAQELLERELGQDNSSLNCFSNVFGTSFNELMDSRRLDSEYYNPKVKSIVKRISAKKNTKVKYNFVIKNGFSWNSKKFLDNNSGEPVVRIRDIKPTYIDNEELTSIDPTFRTLSIFRNLFLPIAIISKPQ